uniref:Uncharacterized protein n=1 Tax=Opuntia streptacantha TaxID=393608 RepID=A0A7C9ELX2_OPUST
MPHSIESSISFQNDHSFLPKRTTSFPLLLPGKWLINRTITKPLKNNKDTNRSLNSNEPYVAGGWAITLLRECARAISEKNPRSQQLLWVLNELVSPYGDCEQRLAYYFLQVLLAKANKLGPHFHESLKLAMEKSYCFDTHMKLILKFQEVSPWTTFGHVASNGAILEALEGKNKLHIIDLSNTLCTQWPTLIEALAVRNDETPFLKLTLVVIDSLQKLIIKEIRQRMEKFSRIMGVPFKFHVISGLDNLGELQKEDLGVEDGEAIAVNCVQALQRVHVEKRELVLDVIRSVNPCIVTLVEEEADLTSTRNDFIKCFDECLRFFRSYFNMLEESFPPISSERIKLEREQWMNISGALTCHGESGGEYRPKKGTQWNEMLKQAFCPSQFSDDVLSDVRALLKRYKIDWDLSLPQSTHETGIHLKWKDENVVWASAWKPS